MYHHIAKISQHPAVTGSALNPSQNLMGAFHGFCHSLYETVEHAVAGSRADYKIIGKVGQLVNVEQQDIFTFFIFQTIHDGMSKF